MKVERVEARVEAVDGGYELYYPEGFELGPGDEACHELSVPANGQPKAVVTVFRAGFFRRNWTKLVSILRGRKGPYLEAR